VSQLSRTDRYHSRKPTLGRRFIGLQSHRLSISGIEGPAQAWLLKATWWWLAYSGISANVRNDDQLRTVLLDVVAGLDRLADESERWASTRIKEGRIE
jgi:hypothetical protein